MISTPLEDSLGQQGFITLLELVGGTAILTGVYHLAIWSIRLVIRWQRIQRVQARSVARSGQLATPLGGQFSQGND